MEGLLRLVGWAEKLRACNPAGGGASQALTSVRDGELWGSFPEATRNDILGLLTMLLERLAVSAGLAAEGTGGEHDASA